MDNILFVSTSHIARQSVKEIKQAFLTFKPDIIAIELDRRRLHALLTNAKPSYTPKIITTIGVKGYLFALIGGLIQRRLGRIVGMEPGADMKQAALLARNNEIPLILLDQDITITLGRLSRAITFKEKMRFIGDLLFGWFKKTPRITIRLDNVPSRTIITQALTHLKQRYPTFYRVLVEERNHIMAQRLAHAVLRNPDKKFLVVIGAGHEEGIKTLFTKVYKELQARQAS